MQNCLTRLKENYNLKKQNSIIRVLANKKDLYRYSEIKL
jgi:hypothetical protein